MYEIYLKDAFGLQILVGLDRKTLQEPYSGKPRDQFYSFRRSKATGPEILHTPAERCWEMCRISRISEKTQLPKSFISPCSVNHKVLCTAKSSRFSEMISGNLWKVKLLQLTHSVKIRNYQDYPLYSSLVPQLKVVQETAEV